MQALTKEQKLIALVLSAPKTKPAAVRDYFYCALTRAGWSLGVLRDSGANISLISIAGSLGFTPLEAMGIMRGWDGLEGRTEVFERYVGEPDLASGVRLGERLWRATHEQPCA